MKKIVLAIVFLIGCATEIAKDEPMRDYGDGIERIDRRGMSVKNGWQASGRLIMLDTTRKVSMQADFADPGNYTVQFSTEAKNVAGVSGRKSTPKARIQWSVEGGTIDRIINVVNGVSISGVAQGVRVEIYDATPSGSGFLPGFDPSYLVACQVVKGIRANVEQPPQLILDNDDLGTMNAGFITVPANSSSNAYEIPFNAGPVSVNVTVSPNPYTTLAFIPEDSVLVRQRSGTGAGVSVKLYDPRDMGFVPLAPAASAIQIRNNNAFDVDCHISFGIDG